MALYFDGPVLGIETSCDETSAAVLVGHSVLSNVISSQIELHKKWGGVVPEAAARAHVEAVLPVITETLEVANTELGGIAGIAVTNRPGLIGALSVGVCAAKALSFSLGLPLIGIHHLEGHVLSPLALSGDLPWPHLCLVVSGGHTEIVEVQSPGKYLVLGQTLDDAAGEAFDKSARLLGFGYPGGRAIQDHSIGGDPKRYKLPRGLHGDTRDFSFSGLKTAVLRLVEAEGSAINITDACASIQEAIISVLSLRLLATAESTRAKAVTLVGGVAANRALRDRIEAGCDLLGIPFFPAPIDLCTDNAAMIALAGSIRLARGERDGWDMDAAATADLPNATCDGGTLE